MFLRIRDFADKLMPHMAERIKNQAETTMERLRQERIKAAATRTEPLSDRERLMFIRGVGDRTVVLLDEAGNIAPLKDLPGYASTARSHGITFVTIWQDLAQIKSIYGDRAHTVLNNHLAKLFGAQVQELRCERRLFMFRYLSAARQVREPAIVDSPPG